MFSFERMLFPVDFSDHCRKTAPYVADLANRFRAGLALLHVIEDNRNLEKLWQEREEELASFAAYLPSASYLPRVVAYGNPAQAISRYAETHNIDVIAMPAGGKGRVQRRVLGSVTETVLHQASSAVWTEASNGHPDTRWSPVICAVDLKEESGRVVSYAAALADQFKATLILVHAVSLIVRGFPQRPSESPGAHSLGEAQRKLEDLRQRLDVSAEVVTQVGTVENVIGRLAERTRAELLVIGRGTHRPADGSLGRHTHNLIRTAPCPVVSCPRSGSTSECFWTEWQQESVQGENSPLHLAATAGR